MLEARDLFEETIKQITTKDNYISIDADFNEDRSGEYYRIRLYISTIHHYEVTEYIIGDERSDTTKDRAYIKLLSILIKVITKK
jgi:hypothetical protein